MALTLAWKDRINRWREELPRHFYRPLGTVPLNGFVTLVQLTPGEALARDFLPMPPGTAWGAKWEYGWFAGSLTLPDAAAERRIALAVDVGAESIIFVNGEAAGARDRQHHEITLAMEGVPGTRYDLLIEGYAGHGPRNSHAGPTPPGRETVPEPGPTQAVVGETTFGIWQEDVYQLWLDVETLWQLRDNLDANSLRLMEVDAGLRDFTLIVDFEVPNDAVLATVREGRERLKPLMECVNGSTAPEMFGFGHAHIDVAWLWPLQETERKAGRTMATQLALMAEYPEHKFLQSQPHLYWMLQRRYPDIYARIKESVKAGQYIPEGGAWVEPDTNIPGGEALIRQFVHGKRFFKDEFGVSGMADNTEAVSGAGMIIFAVKPQVMGEVVDGLVGVVSKETLCMSIAAGIKTSLFEGTFHQRNAAYDPIPFAKKCRIVWIGNVNEIHFYQIQIRLYEPSAEVITFQPEDLETYKKDVKNTAKVLSDPDSEWKYSSSEEAVAIVATVPAKEMQEVLHLDGPKALECLSLKVYAKELDKALRQTILHIICDEYPWGQVQSPIGDFFGAAPGINPFNSVPFTVGSDGVMTCRFVMPFAGSVRIEAENWSGDFYCQTGAGQSRTIIIQGGLIFDISKSVKPFSRYDCLTR